MSSRPPLLRVLPFLACAVVLLSALVVRTADGKPAAVHTNAVNVDLAAQRQRIDGFGSTARVWSDPHLANAPGMVVPATAQAQILRTLYGRLGLTRVRNVLEQGVQPARGAPFNFSGKLADDHVAYVKQARRYGVRTFFPGPVYVEPWMTAQDVEAYVNWAMAMLLRWRALGLAPALYAPLNEPQVNNDFPPEWMHQVVLRLGERMRRAGLKTKLVVPDDVDPVAAYRRAEAVLRDPLARRYVAAVAYHIYPLGSAEDRARLKTLAARYGLPLWMTEYSNRDFDRWPDALQWAADVHDVLTTGASAVDYLWGFFGDWTRGDSMISIHYRGGGYADFSETPVYWLTGQWSRMVRPGFHRVDARPASRAGIETTAFVGNGKAVVVAINEGHDPAVLDARMTGAKLAARATGFRTSAAERWRSVGRIPIRGGTLRASLPPQSVTTFVVATRHP